MSRQTFLPNCTEAQARKALTVFRKRYRVAMRGATIQGAYRGDVRGCMLYWPRECAGWSSAEVNSAIASILREGTKP